MLFERKMRFFTWFGRVEFSFTTTRVSHCCAKGCGYGMSAVLQWKMTSLGFRPFQILHTPPEVNDRKLFLFFPILHLYGGDMRLFHNGNKSSCPMKIVLLWRPDGGHAYYFKEWNIVNFPFYRGELTLFLLVFWLRAGWLRLPWKVRKRVGIFVLVQLEPVSPTTRLFCFSIDWKLQFISSKFMIVYFSTKASAIT